MIVDTSALIAVLIQEPGWETVRTALIDEPAVVTANARRPDIGA